MSNLKILITDGLAEKGQFILRAAAQIDDCQGISAGELSQTISGYDAIIVRSRTKLTRQVIETAGRLKVIGRAGVGVDNIDLEAARDHNVTVINTPAATSRAVAELTIGLMFALARSIPQANNSLKNGVWAKRELVGSELNGKTLGIIGIGNIGTAVAQRARALGMSLLSYDLLLTDAEISRRGAQPTPLANLYTCSDYISLHVPLTPETRDMINARSIEAMKPGVRIISTARGGIIDETALFNGLQSGKVSGAALDVFDQEPPGPSPLISHPGVIATPHIGAQTTEAQARAAEDIANEVLAALKGKPLRWKVV
jgi:D-3-phosphoglycerate dehydrogenase